MMDRLISHFMHEYQISKREAEELLAASLEDFEVTKSILKAVYRKMVHADAS